MILSEKTSNPVPSAKRTLRTGLGGEVSGNHPLPEQDKAEIGERKKN